MTRFSRLLCLSLAALSFAFAPVPPYRPRPKGEPGTVTLPSGLRYQDLTVGTGAPAKKGDTLLVHYTGWLAQGMTKIDSSVGKNAFRFQVGAGVVIKGWDEGVVGMKPGGKRRLLIPAALAYGAAGVGTTVPPNADLVFEV